MATDFASDVVMKALDFSGYLRQNTSLKSLFPGIFEEGPIEPVQVSPESLGIYGAVTPKSMKAALEAAMPTGNHWVLRVVSENAFRAGALVGVFSYADDEESTPMLGIAPLQGYEQGVDSTSFVGNYSDLSPVYRDGGIPLNPEKFNVEHAIDEGGDTFFTFNQVRPMDAETVDTTRPTRLLQPLAVLYRTGPESENRFSVAITSQNVAALPAFNEPNIVKAGNLKAGTYLYTRVPVTANGRILNSASETLEVVLTADDVLNSRRAIRLNWSTDDSSVRGCVIYRHFVEAGLPVPNTEGINPQATRIAELARVRTTFLDDTFRSTEPQDADLETSRDTIIEEFNLVVYENDEPVETIAFTFNMESDRNSAAPIDRAINETSGYLRATRLYDEDFIQGDDSAIFYSTPVVPLMGARNGDEPTEDDLERALEPFLNRDRYKCGVIVDLGWCSPYAAHLFSKVEEAQRSHSLLSVPKSYQTAQGAVSYASQLTSGSRRSSIYTPWLKRRDPETSAVLVLPASVYASQVQILSDLATTGGAGRSFAGLNRGITDSIGVEDPDKYEYSDEERDLLAVGKVNYFRRRDNVGMVLWEQMTLQRNLSAASYVNVSRLWDIIQNSIQDFLEYSLQEPNDEQNALSIRTGLNEYLQAHVRARNLAKFEVFTDGRAGNTNDTLDQGIRNIDVYLTPVIAARRYLCRTILTKQGAKYEDLMQVM